MSRTNDTIAALATPVGTAAIAILRVSGPDTAVIADGFGVDTLRPRRACHTDYRAQTGVLLDDVIMTYFAAPHSYTGENSLEISCHGNPFIAQKILADLLSRGCRLAAPGEFTQRSFLNGKMDLSQAEAVMDLIQARSDRALEAANRQLRGGLSQRMNPLMEALLGVLARIEAYIDFPEEDLPEDNRVATIADISYISLETNRLIATEHYGALLRDGIRTVIIGVPNAGKSSLLNRLVGRDRALVSTEPGTTRDFIEERIVVGGHFLRLVDTAGLNPSPAPLERLGIDKTLECAVEADLFLIVMDASATASPALPFPEEIERRLTVGNTLVVLNKIDLVKNDPQPPVLGCFEQVNVSALTGAGLEVLRTTIAAKAEAFSRNPEDLVTINARHAHSLQQARELLQAAEAKFVANEPIELVASDLRGVLEAFGEIVGRVDNERMLDRLFATFCIGK